MDMQALHKGAVIWCRTKTQKIGAPFLYTSRAMICVGRSSTVIVKSNVAHSHCIRD